ncbi:MAG TPA: MBL fold metallo-hydrolase, partial [Pirellulaceae bacterium]
HSQGLAKAKQMLRTTVTAHPLAAKALESGDRVLTLAEIPAQGIDMTMPPVSVEHRVQEGNTIPLGGLKLEVWQTPGHTAGQLAFRLGEVLFSADNIYRDGCVGAIDAQHGSNIPDFIESLQRIRKSDVKYLLPSHGPIFAKDNALLDRAIARLQEYRHRADFGTCATDWPLMDEWEREIADGKLPFPAVFARPSN